MSLERDWPSETIQCTEIDAHGSAPVGDGPISLRIQFSAAPPSAWCEEFRRYLELEPLDDRVDGEASADAPGAFVTAIDVGPISDQLAHAYREVVLIVEAVNARYRQRRARERGHVSDKAVSLVVYRDAVREAAAVVKQSW